MRVEGVIPPLVTPADRTGELERSVVESYVEHLLEGGVHGLMPCGSIGEFPSLTREQRCGMIESVVDAAADMPVLAGCGGTSLASVLRHTRDAAEAGADAAVIVTPYYFNASPDGLREFYGRVAGESPLPVFLYHLPQRTGQEFPVELVAELAHRDGIVGIKDSSGDFRYHYKLIQETPEEFSVIQGLSEFGVPSLNAGADGMITGIANVYPNVAAEVYAASAEENYDRAMKLIREVFDPLVGVLADIPTPSGLKYILTLSGHDVGDPIPPIARLTDQEKRLIEEIIDSIDRG